MLNKTHNKVQRRAFAGTYVGTYLAKLSDLVMKQVVKVGLSWGLLGPYRRISALWDT